MGRNPDFRSIDDLPINFHPPGADVLLADAPRGHTASSHEFSEFLAFAIRLLRRDVHLLRRLRFLEENRKEINGYRENGRGIVLGSHFR